MIKRCVILLLTAIYYIFILELRLDLDRINYCYSDVYMCAAFYGAVVVAFMSGIYFTLSMKHAYRESVIILENDMKKVWFKVSRRIFGEAICMVLILFAVCTVYAYIKGYSYACNWQEDYSNGWHALLKHTDVYVDTWVIQLTYIVDVFSEISVSAMLLMLLWWWLRYPVYGLCLITLLASVEMYGYTDTAIFFRRISVYPDKVYVLGFDAFNQIAFPVIAVVLVWLAGWWLLRKRDML